MIRIEFRQLLLGENRMIIGHIPRERMRGKPHIPVNGAAIPVIDAESSHRLVPDIQADDGNRLPFGGLGQLLLGIGYFFFVLRDGALAFVRKSKQISDCGQYFGGVSQDFFFSR